MLRVPNLPFRLLSLAVAAAVLGFLQLAVAQNCRPSQDPGNQEAPARQSDTSKDPQVPPTFADGKNRPWEPITHQDYLPTIEMVKFVDSLRKS